MFTLLRISILIFAWMSILLTYGFAVTILKLFFVISQLIHDGSLYHIETRPLIYSVNQSTGFYMIGASVMTELNVSVSLFCASLYEILRVLVLKPLSF